MGCMGEWAGELRAGSGASVEAAGTVGSALHWKDEAEPCRLILFCLSC